MLYINFVCDGHDCKHMQPASFDKETETCKDLFDAVAGIGWMVVKEEKTGEVIRTLCPDCVKK